MKRLIVALILIATVGAGAAAWYRQRGGPDIEVATSPVSRGDIVDTVGATGALQAVTTVQVGSQVSGNIQWLGADFNAIVKRGQEIARLDPSMFDAQLQQARANLSQTRANLVKAESELERTRVQLIDAQQKYARANELFTRKLLAPSDLDAAKVAVDVAQAAVASQQATVTQTRAAVTQSEASVNQAQVNRDHTVILAPIDGIVTERSVDVGQTVAASMQAPTLFVIAADLKQMQVLASVDEADVGRIRPNQRVTFRVDAYPTDTFEGTVSQVRLQPIVVQNVTTYGTLITAPNPQLRLKPGMTATVKIEVARRTDVLRVPNLALRFRPTTEMFAALNQPVPADTLAGGGRSGRNGPPDAIGAGAPPAPARPGPALTPSSPEAGAAPGRPGEANVPGRGGARGRPPAEAGGTGAVGGDRQAAMVERYKSMSPEEQQQFAARMKERGLDLSALAAGAPAEAGGPPAGARPSAGAAPQAQTIDDLFAPLPPIESRARLWLFVDGQIKPVNVRLGVTDGSYTELLSGELQENMALVTGISGVTSARTNAPPAGAANPLMPGRPGGRGGAPRGGR
ncbi:MAG: efflux RND transporter periplasmic adaptor subunit [Acidobacteria bacterium]|nr:efflux RND transporter periplasmic adaptor subunit [Acidobacteriota bacterium]